MSVARIACIALLVCGCATAPTFQDRPIVWRVNDRKDMAQPESNDFLRLAYFTRVLVTRRITRAMQLPDAEPARNVNALDEVPNSSWFENRIGARDMSPDEVARGPVTLGPPQLPLTVVRGKDTGGGNPGFFVRD